MIAEKEFINRLNNLSTTIESKTKTAAYTDFKLKGNVLHFRRVNPKTFWNLDIIQLYKIYSTNNYINTSVIKKSTGGRVNSPSVAILMAINCIDEIGNRIK